MIFPILSLIFSLIILLLSADIVVRGAVALALKLSVPPLLIGLTIVAFGTSAPELVISAEAVLDHLPGIAIGNVVGSNIANVLLVLGLSALILPIATSQPTIRRNTVLMIASTLLLIWISADQVLTFWDGAILFFGILLFLIHSGLHAGQGPCDDSALDELREMEESGTLPATPLMIATLLLAGLIGLPIGSALLLDSAEALAIKAGVPEDVIGLSLVALGTSLPELATALAAALRGQSAVAMGNVIGSNIFNILAVLGVASMIADIPIPSQLWSTNLWVMLGSSAMIAPFVFTKRPIGKLWGIAFLIGYIVFLYLNFSRGY